MLGKSGKHEGQRKKERVWDGWRFFFVPIGQLMFGNRCDLDSPLDVMSTSGHRHEHIYIIISIALPFFLVVAEAASRTFWAISA